MRSTVAVAFALSLAAPLSLCAPVPEGVVNLRQVDAIIRHSASASLREQPHVVLDAANRERQLPPVAADGEPPVDLDRGRSFFALPPKTPSASLKPHANVKDALDFAPVSFTFFPFKEDHRRRPAAAEAIEVVEFSVADVGGPSDGAEFHHPFSPVPGSVVRPCRYARLVRARNDMLVVVLVITFFLLIVGVEMLGAAWNSLRGNRGAIRLEVEDVERRPVSIKAESSVETECEKSAL